jgi:hypothetical protein
MRVLGWSSAGGSTTGLRPARDTMWRSGSFSLGGEGGEVVGALARGLWPRVKLVAKKQEPNTVPPLVG